MAFPLCGAAMTDAKPLFDRPALDRARARARRAGPACFLHDEARREIEERLSLVNKSFTRPAIVTGWPDAWDACVDDAKIVSDSETLDLEPGAHDLILHAMGLHWSNDPVGQLIQCRRALRPDGLFLGVMFGGQTLHELRAAMAEAETHVSGGLSPRISPMAEIRDLGALLQRAGFALPVADSQPLTVSYSDVFGLMRDLRAMAEVNTMTARRKTFARRQMLFETAQRYAEAFGSTDGRVTATFELIHLAGWAPHDSQQKPLRPGSAMARLADVLGTDETKLRSEIDGEG